MEENRDIIEAYECIREALSFLRESSNKDLVFNREDLIELLETASEKLI